MTRIYLIRHAEAEGNLYRIAHGHEEGLITDYRGPRQIRALAQRFRDIPVDAVYASDLIRTQTTAQAIYMPKGLPLHPDPAFREIGMGVWEGLTWRQIETRWPLQLMEFNRQMDRWHVEGCETARMVLDRYLPALRRVAREHDGQTVAIFSHGAALRIVLGTLQGLSLADIGQTPHGDNTAVSLIEADGDELRVVFRDDNSHLTGQEGLSTFGKQTWWKTKGMVEPGQLYRPASHEQCRLFGAPESGQSTAVWYNGQELIGLFQTVREPDALRITWYGMDPLWRGRRQGIPPMGQIIQQGRQERGGHVVAARRISTHGSRQLGIAVRIAGEGKGRNRFQQHGVAQAVRHAEFRAQRPGHAVDQSHGAVGKGQSRLQRAQQAFTPGFGVVGPLPGLGQKADQPRGGPQGQWNGHFRGLAGHAGLNGVGQGVHTGVSHKLLRHCLRKLGVNYCNIRGNIKICERVLNAL